MTATVRDGDVVVAILRQCRACGVWKPQHHFLNERGSAYGVRRVRASLKVCAACRGRGLTKRGVERNLLGQRVEV